MKKFIFLFIILLFIQPAAAVLPPQYQNMNDLDAMVDFIKAHPQVAATLRSIDLEEYTIHFGEGCTAEFGRKTTQHPLGWVGPANPLEFQKSNCPVDVSQE